MPNSTKSIASIASLHFTVIYFFQTFQANNDNNKDGIIEYDLNSMVQARYVRYVVMSFVAFSNTCACLRMEIFNCQDVN